jgi:signal transduction histidine kinase
MPPGTRRIPARFVTVRPSTGIAIAVEDHGAGISKEEQRRVFGKFVRGAAARALT